MMKLFCSQKELDKALNIVGKAINVTNTLPVLSNVLLKAEGKKLHFSATNLEIAITFSIDADVRSEGAITVPAKLLTNYVALLSDEKVEFTATSGNSLSVSSTSSNTSIKGIAADEFPLIPKVEVGQKFSVPTNTLHDAVVETVFAASMNTSRPVLSGVLMKAEKDELTFVATDSYRLAERTAKLESKVSENILAIIPSRTMVELSKIISKAEGKDVNINIAKNQVLFQVDNIELISRLIEGKYPDYKKIIQSEHKTKFEVSVDDLSLALKRASLFARENNNSVKLSVTNDGKLVVSSEETRVGEEKAEILIAINGENNKISLNSQYLLEVLNFINCEKVEISLNDKVSPAHIKPVKRDDYLYIIMPLKV